MEMIKGTHDCDERYELKPYKKLFTCDGCKMRGFGKRYVCNLCGNELHKECRHPKTTVTHKYFAGSTFAFRKTPFTRLGRKNRMEYSKVCDACGQDICGFSYHCEADNLDLHPRCLKLKDKEVIGDMIFNLRSNVSLKCKRCKKREVSNSVPGWSYVSSCNKYHLHVYCMTEMVHEVYTKNNGDLSSLESFDLGSLVKPKKISRGSSVIEAIKSFVKIVLAVVLGDPTVLISSVLVELVARGLQ